MKKFGKFEKRPEAAQKKQPNVKSALLQTYMTSLLCLLLCVTMFFGTSYAWFTSEVTNEGNEIYIGTLDVGLFKQIKKADNTLDWASLSETENGVNKTSLFDKGIRWEPGFTALETIKVVNEGDLAFKYELSFVNTTPAAAAAGTELTVAQIAEHFDVWVYDHYHNQGVAGVVPNPGSYDILTAENSGWKHVGLLKDVLEGRVVLEGVMRTVRENDFDPTNPVPTDPTDPANTDIVKTVDTYTIALHMKDTAPSEVMGKKIVLNVKLIAYQMAKEQDGFGNAGYDDADYVTNAKQLQEALDKAKGKTTIRFGCDITGNVTVTQKEGVEITVDGAGHKLNGTITVDGKSQCYETAALTIQNITFAGVTGEDTIYISLGNGNDSTRYTNNVTVKNCAFESEGMETAAIKSHTGGDKNLTITGCTVGAGMHSMLQVANIEEGLKIYNCKVYSKNGINLNSTPGLKMVGCTFEVQGYAVRFGQKGTFSDDDIRKVEESYVLTNNILKSVCAETGDAVIIFRGDAVNATLTLENTTVEATVAGKDRILGNTGATTINGLN